MWVWGFVENRSIERQARRARRQSGQINSPLEGATASWRPDGQTDGQTVGPTGADPPKLPPGPQPPPLAGLFTSPILSHTLSSASRRYSHHRRRRRTDGPSSLESARPLGRRPTDTSRWRLRSVCQSNTSVGGLATPSTRPTTRTSYSSVSTFL